MGFEKQLIVAAAVFAVISQSEGIMGGREAASHSRPYMASIQVVLADDNMRHECGGFLIADQWVMTAAHCLPSGPNGRKVVLGAHSLSTPEDTKQTFDILQVHNHPDFSRYNYDSDIALIKLDRPFVASEAVSPVKYLRAGGTNPGTGVRVDTAGWGSVNNLDGRTDTLKELFMGVVNRVLCARYDYYGRKFTRNMLCAYNLCRNSACSGPQKTEDTCDGDSGGPLLFNGVAVGITSNGGKKCGQVKKPGIYTIISQYTQWIDNTLAGGSVPTAESTTADT